MEQALNGVHTFRVKLGSVGCTIVHGAGIDTEIGYEDVMLDIFAVPPDNRRPFFNRDVIWNERSLGLTRTTTSNEEGDFVLPFLPPGTCILNIELGIHAWVR
jgi:hypothetical protein